MLLYIYPKCSTCLKAIKFLENKNIKIEIRDIVLKNPSYEEIEKYIELSGKDIKKFFNTSGIKYRELGLKDKLKLMSKEEMIKLLASDGMLIKRPMLVGEDFVLNGFREKEWLDILCNKKEGDK